FRKIKKEPKGGLFVTSGLGGMSGAQPKAGNIAGCVTVCAEVNKKATETRHSQGWVDEVMSDLDELSKRVKEATGNKEADPLAYDRHIDEIRAQLAAENLHVELGREQAALDGPGAGGDYPVGVR